MKIKVKNKNTSDNKRKKPRTPRKITRQYLHNAGLYYLERYAASSAHFEFIMKRKIMKSCAHHTDQSQEDCYALLRDLIKKFQDLGLLDDAQYTKAMVQSLRRQGKSKRFIFAKLSSKGVPVELTEQHLQTYDEDFGHERNSERYAALVYSRKKRLGPFHSRKETPYEKALGSLARAGFSYEIAQDVLGLSYEEAQEILQNI